MSAESVRIAQQALEREAEAVFRAACRLDGSFRVAVELILGHCGKLVVSGLGKSGLISQKLAATFCSTGTPAVFLHPSEAVHGDLGVYSPGDVTLLLSKSGSTAELIRLVPLLRQLQSPLIGILGNVKSTLASMVDVVLDGSVEREADPWDIAPTCSTAVAMALGDGLASALMHARKFTLEDYGRLHPGGQLGRNLNCTVRDVMHSNGQIAWVQPQDSVRDIVITMTEFPLGAACVVEGREKTLVGLITDGDIRRALRMHDDVRVLHAEQIMTSSPVTALPETRVRDALQLMENRESQISVLPVVNGQGCCLGLVRIHDIYHQSS